ncbi:MauE/DoxX family redox-associated membrane protein [Pedobacter antarcticus]|uniref:MauE/DoxX family redox-associated membrane protein n=1 Tax=Pedobacter antarcticus TaxID=34086 RepID=UPI001C56612B|nr:MauE/DoxX family redox-associated membrane protein [Pedobacter antarcticus]
MAILISYIITALFIILWLYAALPKLWGIGYFHEVLKSQAIPRWSIGWIALFLPLTELTAAGLLLFPSTRLIGMSLSLLLMLIFSIYVSGIIFQVYDKYPCPCGGLFTRMGWRKHLKVNLVLTLIALGGVMLTLDNFD